jgi:hypothetical protein
MGEHSEHREIFLESVSHKGLYAAFTSRIGEGIQQERTDPVMLAIVGDHESNLGLCGRRSSVVAPYGNEPAVVLGHQSETVPVIDPREPIDLLG